MNGHYYCVNYCICSIVINYHHETMDHCHCLLHHHQDPHGILMVGYPAHLDLVYGRGMATHVGNAHGYRGVRVRVMKS